MVRTKRTTNGRNADNYLLKVLHPPLTQNLQTARKSTAKSSVNAKKRVKGPKKKIAVIMPPGRRHAPGAKALKDIRFFQNTTHHLIKRSPFQQLIRGICLEMKIDVRFQVAALEAFQVNISNSYFAQTIFLNVTL